MITETELRLMAALAIIGLKSSAEERIEHAGGDRDAERVVEEGEDRGSGGCCAWWRG